jgi:hypothetical protein
MSEWQPIETAPKDATTVRVLTRDGREVDAHWACDLSGSEQPAFVGWFEDLGSYYGGITPTHWQPLPAPPKEVEQMKDTL